MAGQALGLALQLFDVSGRSFVATQGLSIYPVVRFLTQVRYGSWTSCIASVATILSALKQFLSQVHYIELLDKLCFPLLPPLP